MRSLVNRLASDFPEFSFTQASGFWWSAQHRTIHFDAEHSNAQAFLFHELSHALLDHRHYVYDIDLIKLERDAWNYAQHTLAAQYNDTIGDDVVQDNLDTYREWLHARSTCPDCHTSGLQTKQQTYRCFGCGHEWRVNEARLCALRRYTLQTKERP